MKLLHLFLFSCLIGNALAMEKLPKGLNDAIEEIDSMKVRINNSINNKNRYNSFTVTKSDFKKQLDIGSMFRTLTYIDQNGKKQKVQNSELITIKHSKNTTAKEIIAGLKLITCSGDTLDITELQEKSSREAHKFGIRTGLGLGIAGTVGVGGLFGFLAWYKKLISFNF